MGNTAFPIFNEEGITSSGLTKREYFALHLMAGHLAGDGAFCSSSGALDTPETAARKAVQYADALIEALSK